MQCDDNPNGRIGEAAMGGWASRTAEEEGCVKHHLQIFLDFDEPSNECQIQCFENVGGDVSLLVYEGTCEAWKVPSDLALWWRDWRLSGDGAGSSST